ncbi:MAG: hypothetical protein ACOY4H_09430 [Thermodesulfobacteriota bacterium]
MAKCTICNSRKGKRKCKTTETFICSLCCGESRIEEKCAGCSFFTPAAATRNYRSVPYFTTQEMADNPELERIADVIESTLCQVWANDPQNVNDRSAARLVELMIDKYHFNDEAPQAGSSVEQEGFRLFVQKAGSTFSQISPEQVVKVLAAVYRSIQRRTVGGASYLQFVSQFTGISPAL